MPTDPEFGQVVEAIERLTTLAQQQSEAIATLSRIVTMLAKRLDVIPEDYDPEAD